MSYQVTAIGDDWVEIWDGSSIVDHGRTVKNVDQVYVGFMHDFKVGDEVGLKVFRIDPVVEEEVVPSVPMRPFLASECDTCAEDGTTAYHDSHDHAQYHGGKDGLVPDELWGELLETPPDDGIIAS